MHCEAKFHAQGMELASNVTNLAMSSIVPRVQPGRIFTADGHKLGTLHVGFITALCAFLTFSGPRRKRAVSRAFSNDSFSDWARKGERCVVNNFGTSSNNEQCSPLLILRTKLSSLVVAFRHKINHKTTITTERKWRSDTGYSLITVDRFAFKQRRNLFNFFR